MYLKTLELYGFKSFPDKTVISFNQGMTAIVGANGSGKSNVSDAVRFVLGEMSPKTLRGSKMEDVIFNGTATRRSANFAEVTMVLDNAGGATFTDRDEISVSRRLYRTGESEYRLNGEGARLKDVVDAFLNTGIGREGYSVIGQGKISDILSQKGSERRDVFEEAAGISKYRYRKTEVVSKLRDVSENEVRIGDILNEIEDRLPQLTEQAQRAEEHRSLSSQRKALELAICAEQLQDAGSARDELTATLEEENTRYRAVCDVCETTERALDRMYLETQEENLSAEKKRASLLEAAGKNSELVSALSVLENEIHHFEQDGETAAQKEAELSARAREGAALVEKASRTAAEKQAAQEEASEALNQKKQAFSQEEEALLNLRAQEEALSAHGEEIARQLHQTELSERERSVLEEARIAQQAALCEKEKAEQSALNEEQTAQTEAQGVVRERQSGVQDAQKALSDNRAALARVGAVCATLEQRVAAGEQNCAVLEEKIAAAERLMRQFEGYPESVKSVMQAQREGTLSGIFGPVSALFSASEEYASAIEAALGAASGHLVCADEQSAKDAIRFLKSTGRGRATFLPLTTVERRRESFSDLSDTGFVGSALSLAQFDEQYLPVAEYLLGKCAVSRDLDAAQRIASSRGYRLKVVTLDGQIIHAGGSFTGGAGSGGARLLTREKDRTALVREKERAEKALNEAKAELVTARKEENALAKENSALRERQEGANLALFEAQKELSLAEQRVAEKQSALAATKAELSRLLGEADAESARAKEQLEKLRAEQIKTEEERAANKQQSAALSEAIEAHRAEILEQTEEVSRLLSEKALALAEKEAREREARQVNEALAAERALKEACADSARAAKEKIAALSGERTQMSEASGTLETQIEEAKAHIASLEQQTQELRARQKEALSEREALLASIQVKAAKLERMESERALYLTRIAEEYEIDEQMLSGMKIEPGTAKALGGKAKLSRLRNALRSLGPINEGAPEELAALSERQSFLRAQYDDIVSSKEGLENLILSLDKTMRELFLSTFEKLRAAFRQTFQDFFGGGSADILLSDREDLLNCEIELTVQPPGKNVKKLSLLSGGEQSFVAIALYLALLQVNPTPFCIFDEIESALDETNVSRFADYIRRHSDKTQFLLITHRRGTMEKASVLYGITMQEKGVSDFIRLAVDEVGTEFETA